ncbi:uncharacterized protein TNCT_585611 [Trichonephila clavata]|uniref:BTB domain-containing protein n=1 Tax=Trichonephila clavata TaxID=2740835 RepID=A0A8X6GG66_TRICU|nr:uncharacterized protein TNCT_585611 [Trichonephila clavata]
MVKVQSKSIELNRQKLTKEERNSNEVENGETSLSRKFVDEIQSTRFKNDIDFLKEIIFYLMTEEEEFFVEEDFENDKKNEWYLNVETMDGAQFAIPFENTNESLGSKLVASSPVFEAMLKHPMQERSQKSVELSDINSQTFINFLNYLKSGVFKEESVIDVFNLYKFGDKYIIKDLMRMCADRMASYSSMGIIDVGGLADMHNDDYLLQLVESLKNKKLNSFVSHPKMDEALNIYRNPFEKNESEQYSEFDFYH